MNLQAMQISGKLLADSEAFASTLFLICADEFGLEFIDWEPETIEAEINQAWKVRPPRINKDKIMALTTFLGTDAFYRNLEGFLPICHALNNVHPNFQVFEPATVNEIAWALVETHLLEPPDEKAGDKFDVEITSYMRLQLQQESFTKAPKILAPFVGHLDENESDVNSTMEPEGIDYKAYWNDQTMKRLEIDNNLKVRLALMLQQMASLPLVHAQSGALKQLLQRSERLLAGQTRETSKEEASVPRVPSM